MIPTYTATEIKKLCKTVDVEYDTVKLITEIIEEDLDLYSEDDLVILMEASMIMFTRCLLYSSIMTIKPGGLFRDIKIN